MATLRPPEPVALATASQASRVGPLERRERRLFVLFLAPGLLLSIGAIFLPVIYAIGLSFYEARSFIAIPQCVGLDNYGRIFADARYWQAFVNGLFYAVSIVVLQVVIDIVITLLLHREFRGWSWLRGAAMAPYL